MDLQPSDPIFKEGLVRSHPLLEKKRLLTMQSERDKLSGEEAANEASEVDDAKA